MNTSNEYVVTLRRMRKEDVPFTIKLRNDHDTGKWFFRSEELTIEGSTRWFLARDPHTDWDFIAELEGEPVGYIAIYNIDWEEKAAEFGSWMVVPTLRGTDVAIQMGRRLIEVAKHGGLRWLYSRGKLENVRSNRACAKVGFHIEEFPDENQFLATINPQSGEGGPDAKHRLDSHTKPYAILD